MSDYFTRAAGRARSAEWLALIDAANEWQQAYDLMLSAEATAYSTADEARVARLQVAEQGAYDAWSHALVAFERAENRNRVSP